ncbi:TRAP transporter substrate-binding protein DctP [Pusillimonas noertemannii]|uniref:TRAP transporter substrate-binding protein DctP n=1 Tax=Pusillimonas noertemannii TaxID=305977 RepID=UPI00037F481C|nr:TRAP transporter substrate-binding protein DctP [Pusillimonas noertemannii]
MKIFKSAAAAVILAIASLPVAAQEFRLLSSWDTNYAYNPYMLEPFIEGVQTASNGKMKFSVSGPETVPAFEQLEPVSAGVFQFLFTHGSYHFGTTPALTLVEGFEADLTKVRESGLFDVLDKHYQKQNLKLVMLMVSPVGAYHMVLRNPVNAQGDLAGRRIRGVATYTGVIDMLNGVTTVLPVSDVYTSIEKGLIDGTAWPIIGALDYRWVEVAKYLLRPGFGVNYEPLFMNLDAWEALSKEDQEILSNVARRVEKAWSENATEVWSKEEKAMIAQGAEISEMGSSQQEKLQQAWSEGLIKQAKSKDAKLTEELVEFARSNGMLK